MDSPFSRSVLGLSEPHNLSIREKRDLIREMSKCPENAPEKLQNWSRKDLLEILCAEIGKERKYTSLSKQKLIENLFKAVSDKKRAGMVEDANLSQDQSTVNTQASLKRPRKNDHPSRLSVATNNLPPDEARVVTNLRYCQNLACRATLKIEDSFCKRCSCCICHKFDDNKDPSLWLFCGSDSLLQGNYCGMSCHLECAIKDERAGIMKNGSCPSLDGSYYCVYCGKVNDLLGCWKKQLMVAKDARRVDVLCYRISLSHKLLSSTEKYQRLHEVVQTAMNKLEAEVGPLVALSNISRGIVNRLSVGAEVQKLCAIAVDLSEMMTSTGSSVNLQAQEARLTSTFITFEDISPTSVTLVLGSENMALQDVAGFRLWYRKSDTAEYPHEPTCSIFKLKGRSLITDLDPATDYKFKLVAFSNTRELGMWEVEVKTEDIPVDDSMGLAPETSSLKPLCQSPNTNSNGLSNPSEGDESNNNSTTNVVLSKSDESYFDCCEKPEIRDLGKVSDHTQIVTSKEKSNSAGTGSEVEVIEPDETTTGHADSAIDEEPNSTVQTESHKDSTHSIDNNQIFEIPKSENESNTPDLNETLIVPFRCPDHTLPVTPCRVETNIDCSGRGAKVKAGIALPESGSMKPDREPVTSSKNRSADKLEEIFGKAGSSEGSYEYCVKVVRWLECERHIETNFRVKFLTWFSLYATPQERKVVSVYVDTLIDDPSSLAGQLVDTFSETICSKRPPPVPTGFCMKLWH